MKKNILSILLLCVFQYIYSQKYTPKTESGTHLEYMLDLHGQKRTLTITTEMSSDSLIMDWNLRGIKGTYVILPEAITNGTRMSVKQLVPFKSIVLQPDETFCIISRSAFQDLILHHHFVYNGTTYLLKEGSSQDNNFELNGKSLAVLHVKARIDDTEMWVANNPDFPFIYKMTKNPLGINYLLLSISMNHE